MKEHSFSASASKTQPAAGSLTSKAPAPGTSPQAGAVLRRSSPLSSSADRQKPADWAVLRPRPLTSYVDFKDEDNSESQDARSALSRYVDTKTRRPSPFRKLQDGAGEPQTSAEDRSKDAYVDTKAKALESTGVGEQGVDNIPLALSPIKMMGPDKERVETVLNIRKRRVKDRASAFGRDPGLGAMPSPVKPGVTRSAKTHEDYVKRGESLLARYRKQLDLVHVPVDAIDPVDFVNWGFSLKPQILSSTWRPYKQGIRALLDVLPHERTEQAIALLDADVTEYQVDTKTARRNRVDDESEEGRRARRTSEHKAKRFPLRDYTRVMAYLKHFKNSETAEWLVDWLIAGLATGLRPVEWMATDVEAQDDPAAPLGRRVWLYVLNAKSTNGRGNGPVRTLDISNLSKDTIAAIRRMSDRGHEWLAAGVYRENQSRCSQMLYRICDRLFDKKRLYSLYSVRHQFVANAKSIYKNEYVAALCGHNVIDTSIENYGKKTSAWGKDDIGDIAAPVEEEVALIQPRFAYFKQRVQQLAEAGIIKSGGTGNE